MFSTRTYLWYRAPFIRLLLPLTAGILLQWYLQGSLTHIIMAFSSCLCIAVLYHTAPLSKKFRFSAINGIAVTMLLIAAGAALTWLNDIRNNKNWFGNYSGKGDYVLVTIEEPLVEKANSYKALARINYSCQQGRLLPIAGKAILYFKKDNLVPLAGYGTRLIIAHSLDEIKNSGNPGGFDFKRYSLFGGITHQAYISEQDAGVLPQKEESSFWNFIYASRSAIITILRRYITGGPELGLAEALLIGYKDDLDKNLVQSYTNTGVVHVIAISGLHLGLIYGLLLFFTKPLKRKHFSGLRFLVVVASLWLFAFLAGAQPSVLRSAVMFTAIAFSQVLNRKSSIYNTLAMSAFVLLCYNPYWLWDVGFQLSYAAVLSIVIFYRSVYNWVYFQNKGVDAVWKLVAISLAAQILTLPVSLYHFHQFPFLFLFANLLAVPLSSLILYAEIALCGLSFIPPVAQGLGSITTIMIRLLNSNVENLDAVSFAVWDGFSISVLQTILLYGVIAGGSLWLLYKSRKAVLLLAVCLFLFTGLRTFSFIKAGNQKKLIVYNVPRHSAIDLIGGRKYTFIGDDALLQNDFLRNFHLQPSRVLHRISADATITGTSKTFTFYNRKIVIIDTTVQLLNTAFKEKIDVLILSKNPKLYIKDLANAFTINQLVLDSSVPDWKAKLWQNDADSLHLPCYSVKDKGAFVVTL